MIKISYNRYDKEAVLRLVLMTTETTRRRRTDLEYKLEHMACSMLARKQLEILIASVKTFFKISESVIAQVSSWKDDKNTVLGQLQRIEIELVHTELFGETERLQHFLYYAEDVVNKTDVTKQLAECLRQIADCPQKIPTYNRGTSKPSIGSGDGNLT